MNESRIERINELYHKAKSEGLTPEEKAEQTALRKEYIAAIRKNFTSVVETISIEEKDGSITNLKDKKK